MHRGYEIETFPRFKRFMRWSNRACDPLDLFFYRNPDVSTFFFYRGGPCKSIGVLSCNNCQLASRHAIIELVCTLTYTSARRKISLLVHMKIIIEVKLQCFNVSIFELLVLLHILFHELTAFRDSVPIFFWHNTKIKRFVF